MKQEVIFSEASIVIPLLFILLNYNYVMRDGLLKQTIEVAVVKLMRMTAQ